MNLKIITLVGLLLIIAKIDCYAFDPENGTYTVGFSSYKVYDHSRNYALGQDSISRPLLIHLWYPVSESNKGVALDYKHYIDLIAQRENFGVSRPDIDNNSFNYVKAYSDYAKSSFGLDTSISARHILASPVFARSGLQLPVYDPAPPLLIYAPSNGKASVQNHVICEYLASHGFMILSVASAGPNSINREPMEESTIAQVMDMEFILNYLVDSLHIQYSSLGLFGFSTGGNAIALFQMRNKQVSAVLSMDGSQEYSYYMKLYKMEDFNLEKTDIPYLSMVNSHEDYSIYPYYHAIASSEKYMFRMPYLDHFGFVSNWRFFESCSSDSDLSKLGISYDYMSACALGFFKKYLQEDPKLFDTFLSGDPDKKYIHAICPNLAPINTLCTALLDHNLDLADKLVEQHETEMLAEENQLNLLARMAMDKDMAIWLYQKSLTYYPDNTEISDLLDEISNEE